MRKTTTNTVISTGMRLRILRRINVAISDHVLGQPGGMRMGCRRSSGSFLHLRVPDDGSVLGCESFDVVSRRCDSAELSAHEDGNVVVMQELLGAAPD